MQPMKLLKQGVIIAALIALARLANAQLQFTSAKATDQHRHLPYNGVQLLL